MLYNSTYSEFVFIKLELHKGHYITVANIYRSPNSTQADDIKLCNLVADVKKDIIIVGDFNFPEIDWDLHYSTNKSFGSTVSSDNRGIQNRK